MRNTNSPSHLEGYSENLKYSEICFFFNISHTMNFPKLNTPTNKYTQQITIKYKSYNKMYDKNQTLTCFGTRVSSSWSLLEKINTRPTCQFSY